MDICTDLHLAGDVAVDHIVDSGLLGLGVQVQGLDLRLDLSLNGLHHSLLSHLLAHVLHGQGNNGSSGGGSLLGGSLAGSGLLGGSLLGLGSLSLHSLGLGGGLSLGGLGALIENRHVSYTPYSDDQGRLRLQLLFYQDLEGTKEQKRRFFSIFQEVLTAICTFKVNFITFF